MTLRVYNTLTREKEPFQTVAPNQVRMYLCGPTVYKTPHIGHMVGPVIFDTIKRYLKFKGFEVTWVVNITDVDDKLIEAANKKNTTVSALAEKHTAEYHQTLAWLGIDTIDHFPKASEYIDEIIRLCQTLIQRGHAYAADGNVWFNVASDPDYGKLSHRKPDEQEAGTRDLAGSGKKNPADFALWKSAKPGEPLWPSPWGKGRPGWHIECSAMSMKLLGPTFDIHGGGLDLLFPHHENELAQSESATGQPFARYWLHNGLTRIKTKAAGGQWQMAKMAGSVGNVINVLDLKSKNENPDLLRYLVLSTHYRRPIEFNDEVLDNNRKALAVFTRLFERIDRISNRPLADDAADIAQLAPSLQDDEAKVAQEILAHRTRFFDMMDDDFNTAGAIGVLHELAGQINSFIERTNLDRDKNPGKLAVASAATQSLRRLLRMLGLLRSGPAAPAESASLVGDIQSLLTRLQSPAPAGQSSAAELMAHLIQLRKSAREQKNFALADSIRKGLTEIGITLEDRPDGTLWRKG